MCHILIEPQMELDSISESFRPDLDLYIFQCLSPCTICLQMRHLLVYLTSLIKHWVFKKLALKLSKFTGKDSINKKYPQL